MVCQLVNRLMMTLPSVRRVLVERNSLREAHEKQSKLLRSLEAVKEEQTKRLEALQSRFQRERASHQIHRGLLCSELVGKLRAQMLKLHKSRVTPLQSGFQLLEHDFPDLSRELWCLREEASARFSAPAEFTMSLNSCRVQGPTRDGALSWHQDVIAAGVEDAPDNALVFWVPLMQITKETPTVQIMPIVPTEVLPHIWDLAGYAVIDGEMDERDVITLDDLDAGDAVSFSPLAIHRTYIPPGATERRISLDIRCCVSR